MNVGWRPLLANCVSQAYLINRITVLGAVADRVTVS